MLGKYDKYKLENWMTNKNTRSKINAMEMEFQRS